MLRELWLEVFVYLPVPTLMLVIASTCKEWRKIIYRCELIDFIAWKSRRIDSLKASIYRRRGKKNSEKNKHNLAYINLTYAIYYDWNSSLSWFWRGMDSANMKKYSKAIRDFTKSLILEPNDFITLSNRSACYRQIGQLDLSMKDIEFAIKLNPNTATHYNNLGVIKSDMGLNEEAIACYSQALEINPLHEDARRNRARRYIKLKQYNEAKKDFKILAEENKLTDEDQNTMKGFINLLDDEKAL